MMGTLVTTDLREGEDDDAVRELLAAILTPMTQLLESLTWIPPSPQR